ncbi:prepilin-type N-terminal cleavage/methylation domain-containing protein [Vibrio rotiferianus]|uniref:prepilin-type N-terminal cleavage/methylation domain-containing protein n=1 Tax=Vibrio rotiferianus TaxID=190895 RepID=UPI00390911E7
MRESVRPQFGMTLIELIIVIVIMGIAMTIFTTALIPQIQNASSFHYQSRAVSLGQSMMSQILARNFDHYVDPNGGLIRCGETALSAPACRIVLGTDGGETTPATFNDVDDYIGCWYTDDTKASCTVTPHYELRDILGNDATNDYRNFRVEVQVTVSQNSASGIPKMKRVQLDVFAGNSTTRTLRLVGYRGNY